MRVVRITDSIFSARYIDGAVRHHIQIVSTQHSLLLLGSHIPNPGFTGLEIIENVVHRVSLASLGHFRLA